MQRWEYLELFLNYYYDRWCDSSGREGTLVRHGTEKQFVHTGGLADELGQQGWELIGIETYPYMDAGNSFGVSFAKWLFKRQRG
jgi:hypothetical protein